MFRSLQGPGVATIVLSAAAFLMITMGTRQSLGLFVSPINTATELGIPAISFALALGQFAWGRSSPLPAPARIVTGRVRCCAWRCW